MAASFAIRLTASGWAANRSADHLSRYVRGLPPAEDLVVLCFDRRAGFRDLAGPAGRPATEAYNGRIQCTYYQYYGPKPGRRIVDEIPASDIPASDVPTIDAPESDLLASPGRESGDIPPPPARIIARPAFGGLSQKAREQAEIFRSRLGKRVRHLRRWPTKSGITCYRLYDRDIPEVPLVVDRYEDCLHLAEYERPHDHTPAEHGDWLDLMKRVAGEVLEIPPANIFLKRRQRQRGPSQYDRVAEECRTKIVSRGRAAVRGEPFRLPRHGPVPRPSHYPWYGPPGGGRQASGESLCLHRLVHGLCGGGRGGLDAHRRPVCHPSRLGPAKHGPQQPDGPAHELIRDDALSFLESCPRRPLFDLAVVDPPTFSNSKRLEEFWDIQRDYAGLLRRLLDLLTPGGVIFFSTNFRRFKLAEEELPGLAVREISRQTVPPDFRNRRIHRCWRMVKAGA